MSVQILRTKLRTLPSTGDYIAVRTVHHPFDETLTLATIQRVTEKTFVKEPDEDTVKIRTLVLDQPMSPDAAIGFATCYAARKRIPVVYTAEE